MPAQRPKVGSGRAEQGPAGSAHGRWVGTAPFSNSPCTLCILLRLGGFTQWQCGLPQAWGSQGQQNKALYSSAGVAPLHPGHSTDRVDPGPGGAGLGRCQSSRQSAAKSPAHPAPTAPPWALQLPALTDTRGSPKGMYPASQPRAFIPAGLSSCRDSIKSEPIPAPPLHPSAPGAPSAPPF